MAALKTENKAPKQDKLELVDAEFKLAVAELPVPAATATAEAVEATATPAEDVIPPRDRRDEAPLTVRTSDTSEDDTVLDLYVCMCIYFKRCWIEFTSVHVKNKSCFFFWVQKIVLVFFKKDFQI